MDALEAERPAPAPRGSPPGSQPRPMIGLREAMAVTHWISSGLFVLGYAVHLVECKR